LRLLRGVLSDGKELTVGRTSAQKFSGGTDGPERAAGILPVPLIVQKKSLHARLTGGNTKKTRREGLGGVAFLLSLVPTINGQRSMLGESSPASRLSASPMPSAFREADGFAMLLVFAVSFAANSTLLWPYQFYADDYPQFNMTAAEWVETRGVWRILGIMLPAWLVSVNCYGLAAISLHAISGYLFYLIARRGIGSVPHALFFTVVMLAFPWGYQALLWASALSFALASCLLWAIIYVLLAFHADRLWRYLIAAGIVCASFLCLLQNEAAFFPLCFAGVIVWMRPQIFRRDWKSAVAVSLSSAVGAGLWGVVYEIFKPAHPIKIITHINPATVFSALFYQYSNLEVFDVWIHTPLLKHIISTLGGIDVVLTLLALCAIPFLISAVIRVGHDGATVPQSNGGQIKPSALLIYMLVLSLGAASIYALGGGYSLDSRKRYLIVPLLVMAVAAATRLIRGPKLTGSLWPKGVAITTSTICIIGCLTSLFMMSLWKQELTRLNLLSDLIVENRLSAGLQVDWNPNINDIWPNAQRSTGVDPGIALNQALLARGVKSISLMPESARQISWNSEEHRWAVLSTDGRSEGPP
jgi:hypothetical protein